MPKIAAVVVAVLMGAPTGVLAQGSAQATQNARQTDISAGYLHVNEAMHGWYVQGTRALTRRWSLIGQLDGSYGGDCRNCEPIYHDLGFLGGVRFGWNPTPRISPFAQVLAGGLHSSYDSYYMTISNFDGSTEQRFQEGYQTDYVVFQPGGGVTVMVTRRFGIRAHVDLQFATSDLGSTLFGRIATGGLVRLGG